MSRSAAIFPDHLEDLGLFPFDCGLVGKVPLALRVETRHPLPAFEGAQALLGARAVLLLDCNRGARFLVLLGFRLCLLLPLAVVHLLLRG